MTIMANQGMREIVNGAQLPGHVGKKISMVGFANNVSAGSTSFTLRSTDNIMVPITLKTPLSKPLEGYVEIHGESQGKYVIADNFIEFSNQQFDAKNYNALCKLLKTVPNLYLN